MPHLLRSISRGFYFQFLPALLLGSITVGLLVTEIIPAYYLIATLIMWVLVCGLGIAVGYHRVFSHKTHNLPSWKENIILFFATFAGQGASILWVAVHRGYHHAHTDTSKDIHSPIAHGKLTAFAGWFYKITENNNPVNLKYSVDLLRKKNHLFFHKYNLYILWGIPLLVSLFDWKLALTGFCLVTMIGSVQDNLINVLGHLKGWIGYRNFDTKDNSYNNLILGYLAWGQGWHNNHHYDPKSFDFGKSISGKWWEWDPTKIFNIIL